MTRDWVTYAVVGTTATVVLAGGAYLAYSWWSESQAEDESGPQDEDATAAAVRLRAARGIQMHALMPSQSSPAGPSSSGPKLPVRSAPRSAPASAHPAAKPASGSKAPAAAPGGRKTCAHCAKPTTGLPLRCSGCKQVYYCQQECQRKAWPEHKLVCKASSTNPTRSPSTSAGGAEAAGSSPSKAPAAASPAKPDTPSTPAPAPATDSVDSATASTASAAAEQAEEPKDFQSALAHFLEEQAKSNTDQMEATFETAVMLFVKGDYRASIATLERVKVMAAERDNKAVQGEVYKWMGHAHNRLADGKQAKAYFEAGAYYAKQHKLTKLEIDCLGGLGCMYRAQGDAPKAVDMLEQALVLSDECQDDDARASTLCNLGAALMPIERLHEAGERQGLATAVMEHANALVNLASALLVLKHVPEAEACYVRALEVFELVEDVDKVVKVLINLSNMKELQVTAPKARQEACKYRTKLVEFMKQHGVRRVDDACSICMEPFDMQAESAPGKELILLACLHCLHNKCWEGWTEQHTTEQGVECPTCRQVVPLFVEA